MRSATHSAVAVEQMKFLKLLFDYELPFSSRYMQYIILLTVLPCVIASAHYFLL